ncbi:methyltransferase domain-containing protein [Tundrisphaera sp. TA3]|uniref:class I SAM-dependent methyltransferase n=1 Tax=Tundrisphaera sp. TA3 TaxID=3435775 RepID=UPI003EC01111
MSGEPPPDWMLPAGVDAPLWRYAHTPRLAVEEDDYFSGHPLFEADARALDARFVEPGPLVDLGCGAGRHSIRFARRGFPVTAVDLSAPMLRTVRAKAQAEGVAVDCVQANLCRLGCFPDATFASAISMFSTLGMIRGAARRREAVAEAFRILRPGGRLALHAHNVWLNLGDRQGRRWLLSELGRRWAGRIDEAGDRRMTYRGVAGMGVHLFTWKELAGDLGAAGFRIDEVLPIDAVHARPIRWPRLLRDLRAGGWLVFARKPG